MQRVTLASQLRAANCMSAAFCGSRRQSRSLYSSLVRSSSSEPSSSGDDVAQTSDTVFKGFGPRPTAADALQNTLAGLSANVGRVSQGKNVILDTTNDEDKWRELDLQVNEYPGQRTFKAIGTGDADFVASMTRCVESVIGTVHTECISTRESAKGNYISVTVGPVWVENPDQVLQIYENMKADGRLRFFF